MGEGNGLEWFRKIKGRFSHIVWLNPGNMNYIPGNYWRETLGILQEEFDMYPLSVGGLETALKKAYIGEINKAIILRNRKHDLK